MSRIEQNRNEISEYLQSFIVSKSVSTNILKGNKKSNNEEKLNSQDISTLLPLSNSMRRLSDGKKNTQPRSAQEFKERLSTFRFGHWTAINISPLLCASYGWYLKGKDILQCITCKAVVCSSLPSPNECDAYATFSAILRQRLETGHKKWCGWPFSPSPSQFLHPPLQMTVHHFQNIITEAHTLCSLGENLPYINRQEYITKLDLEPKHISACFRTESTNIQYTSLLLVLLGWVLDTKDKLKCQICLRSVGLWNLLPLKKEEEYIELQKMYFHREEMKKKREQRRQKQEHRHKMKEEAEMKRREAEKEAEERERKLKEKAKQVREVLDKVTRHQDESLSDTQLSEDSDEGLGEEEEESLLAEEEGFEERRQTESPKCATNEFTDENQERETVRDKDCEPDRGNASPKPEEDGVRNCEQEKDGITPGPEEKHEASTKFEVDCKIDENKNLERETSNSSDELWIEAMGGFTQHEDSPAISSEDDDHANPEPSMAHSPANKKRRRSSSDSYSSNSPDEEDHNNPSKSARLEVEEAVVNVSNSNAVEDLVEDTTGDENESENDDDSEGNKQLDDNQYLKMNSSLFDPLNEHHHWCGWVSDIASLHTNESCEDVVGYRILPPQIKEILPEMALGCVLLPEKYSCNVEGLRALRSVLDSWALPEDEEQS